MSQQIAILGAGISGQAARRLAHSLGFGTCLFDQEGRGDDAVFTKEKLQLYDTVVISPGFSESHPWRQIATESDVPCFGELGFAARHWKGQIIGVTGTNGKSTLTQLITQALEQSGKLSVSTGNIGYPMSDAVISANNTHQAYAVCEISSFQAELPFGLELDALIWSNFAEDHLDRYPTMKAYFCAKAKLFGTLKSDAVCVLGPQVEYWMGLLKTEFNSCSVAFEDPVLTAKLSPKSPFRHFPHTENFALASELWWMLDLPSEALVQSANDYVLAPHRLHQIAECNGVKFWNDSKATNFHATLAALSSLSGPIYWIGGGQEKGGDIEAFGKEVAGHVEAAYIYGSVAGKLGDVLEIFHPRVHLHVKFEDAVTAAAKAAVQYSQANVLLSPGFSSFDQFTSYDERGKCFNSLVLGLKDVQAR